MENVVYEMLEGMSKEELLSAVKTYEDERERLQDQAADAENLLIEVVNEKGYDAFSDELAQKLGEKMEFIIEDRKGLMSPGDGEGEGFDDDTVSFT